MKEDPTLNNKTFDEILTRVLTLFPDAILREEGCDNELIICTGLYSNGDVSDTYSMKPHEK